MNLWKLLLLLLLVGIDGDEGEADDEGDAEDEGEADDEGDAEDEGEADDEGDAEDDPKPRETRAQREIRTLRERAQSAEQAHQTAMAQLEEARRGAVSHNSQPTEEQLLRQQEDEVLNNPQAEPWQKYAVNSARDARAARADSQMAVRRAEDLADKTSFNQLAVTKPKLYEAYKDRVEEMLQQTRKNGGNAPRESILALLVGQDMVAGKIKTTEGKSAKKNGGAERGKTPGVRSTVAKGSGGMTEAQKRTKRLEGVRI